MSASGHRSSSAGGNDGGSGVVTDDELHAFVDGQLAAARVAPVLDWLQAHPRDAARVVEWQAQRLHLRRLAREIDVGTTPPALTEVVRRAAGVARRRFGAWQAAAAALLLAVGLVGGVAGARWWAQWAASDVASVAGRANGNAVATPASPVFVREAALAHAVFVPEKRHPVEVTAADEAHLVQWLSRRLGTPLKVPSLAERGYRLLGGRLLPGADAPRAQFMYENTQGQRVTLFVAVFAADRAPADTSFRSLRNAAGESFYWVENRFGYALSADIDASSMQALARDVYEQLPRQLAR